MMKKIVSTLFSLLLCMAIFAQSDLLKQADQAYSQGDFKKAAALYQEVASTEGVSSDLYYNLGNAYFKERAYPESILNYERALLLNPGNGDAKFNLQLAKMQITDKIEPIGHFFLTDWFNAVRDLKSSNFWATWGVIAFILTIAALFLYVFSRKMILRKVGFFGGAFLLVVCIFSNIFAASQKEKLELREHAIVFTPTVTVKSSPAESGTDLFVIHEGTKVKVKSTLAGWSEIELEDGNLGWLPSGDIEVI
ncbi:MAG: tetratricopeptide repeat protein [Bacteroidales bacterium]